MNIPGRATSGKREDGSRRLLRLICSCSDLLQHFGEWLPGKLKSFAGNVPFNFGFSDGPDRQVPVGAYEQLPIVPQKQQMTSWLETNLGANE